MYYKKKDGKYIGFGTLLSDKQIEDLGRTFLYSKTRIQDAFQRAFMLSFIRNSYHLSHLVT